MSLPTEALRALEKAVELVAKATPGPWLYRAKSNTFHGPPPEGTNYSFGYSIMAEDADYPTFKDEDIDALLAAVNFIREHGSAILATASEQAPVAWVIRDSATGRMVWDFEASVFDSEGDVNEFIGQLEDDDENVEGLEPAAVSFSSPAQTSEERDAARLDWLEKHGCWRFSGPNESDIRGYPYRWFDYDTEGSDYSATLREAIDGAMRQEGGSDE